MNRKILLINPPNNMQETFNSAKVFINKAVPFGLLHIYTYLKHGGFDVEFYDCFNFGITSDILKKKIAKDRPGIVGISCLTANGEMIFHIGQWIKQHVSQTWVVLGNIHASVYSEFYLKHDAADIIVHGEGELTMALLSEAKAGRQTLDSIPNISYKKDGCIICNRFDPQTVNIDQLPSVYQDDIDFVKYQPVPGKSQFMILSSRGCAYQCNFCVVHCKERYRQRDIKLIVNEMKYISKRYHSQHFSFIDALFTGSRKQTRALCLLIKKELPDAKWTCEAHFNSVDEDILSVMKDAGCYRISFGVESGNQNILDAMGKKTSLKTIRHIVTRTKELCIQVDGCFILGYIGETCKTMTDTIKLALDLPFDEVQFSAFCPYPGSLDFKKLVDQKKIPFEFNDVEGTLALWKRFNSYTIFNDIDPIYVPQGLRALDIRNFQRRAIRRFYLRPSRVWPHIKAFLSGNSTWEYAFYSGISLLKLFRKN